MSDDYLTDPFGKASTAEKFAQWAREQLDLEQDEALESAGMGPIGPIPEGQARELSDLLNDDKEN